MDQERPEFKSRPLRRDAEHNRKLIINAAAAVFAEQGLQVDVREIARCAGVGMGTLYRHFPTKELLIETVMHQAFQNWSREAHMAMDREPDPLLALRNFMQDSISRQATHRALIDTLTESFGETSGMAICMDHIRPVVISLVERSIFSGEIRADVNEDDILALMIALGRITQLQPAMPPAQMSKYIDIVLDGLRSHTSGESQL